MDDLGIKGKVALVTGAAQGIGEAVARAFAEHGAHVAALDRHAERLETAVAGLSSEGFRVRAYPADVSDSAAVEQAVERIENELGPIGILANVAGVLRPGPIGRMSDEDWAATFAVNATGVFYVSRSVIERMAQRRSGSIVTVGSNAAGVPRMQIAAYAASKAAATMFTKCLGLEYAGSRIRCNIVSPGSTDTDMQRSLWQDEATGALMAVAGSPKTYKLGIPLGRMASPADIADAVVFMASDRARHITMQDLRVDGGATL
jgi:2,3-dihydro-2,3-dihydroxybenzoate dehydrogenase